MLLFIINWHSKSFLVIFWHNTPDNHFSMSPNLTKQVEISSSYILWILDSYAVLPYHHLTPDFVNRRIYCLKTEFHKWLFRELNKVVHCPLQ